MAQQLRSPPIARYPRPARQAGPKSECESLPDAQGVPCRFSRQPPACPEDVPCTARRNTVRPSASHPTATGPPSSCTKDRTKVTGTCVPRDGTRTNASVAFVRTPWRPRFSGRPAHSRNGGKCLKFGARFLSRAETSPAKQQVRGPKMRPRIYGARKSKHSPPFR